MSALELVYETIQFSPFFGVDDPDLPGQIRAAARAGFRWIGVDHRGTLLHFTQQRGKLSDVAELLGENGIRCFSVQDLDVTADERATLQLAERCAEAAAALGAKYVHTTVSAPLTDATLALYRRALELVRGAGVQFALEFLPWTPLNDIRTTREILARLALPDVGMLVDTWHWTHGPSTLADLEALPLAEIAYVQFDDHPPLASDDLLRETISRRALPGDGEFALAEFAQAVCAKGYRAPVSVEILNDEMRAWPKDVFAKRVYEAAIRFWS